MPTLKLRGGIKRVPTGSPLLNVRRPSEALSVNSGCDTGEKLNITQVNGIVFYKEGVGMGIERTILGVQLGIF